MSPKNPDDEAGKASGADFSSYRRQDILDLRNCGITKEDIMSARIGISQKKVDKIKSQEAEKEEVVGRKNKYLKENSHSSFLQSSSSINPQVGLNSIMKKSHARVRKTLEGKPDFVMSFVETQNVLEKFAKYKTTFVVLHVDLGSTKLAMRLPLDRLTTMIQAFNQEMTVAVKAFGGIF